MDDQRTDEQTSKREFTFMGWSKPALMVWAGALLTILILFRDGGEPFLPVAGALILAGLIGVAVRR